MNLRSSIFILFFNLKVSKTRYFRTCESQVFTERQRYEIEAYLKAGLKPKEIAKLVGKCVRTIYYELKRGKCKQLTSDLEEKEVYLADVSQRKYDENKLNKGASLKIGNDIGLK